MRGSCNRSSYPKSSFLIPNTKREKVHRFQTSLLASMDDREDEDDDEPVADLGDWRNFRKGLLESGLNTGSPEEGIEGDGSGLNAVTDDASHVKSVSKMNEQLLASQNAKLAEEYLSGVWCHKVAKAEVGGLVIRMPLEYELWYHENSRLGKRLKERLQLTSDGTEYDVAGTEGEGSLSEDEFTGSVKTAYWFKSAQEMIKTDMQTIVNKGDTEGGGRIDPASLTNSELEMLEQYLHCQETWQEVCLVVEKDESMGTSSSVVINRPLATRANVDLASMCIFGEWSNDATSDPNKIVKFLDAFKDCCPIYVGGPDNHGKPALFIHGISELDGAKEISPGTELYIGGLDAAIDGILDGKYDPLEFRFFVGKHCYSDNELETRVEIGQYQPLACARSLALKQCIQLPKPLWHEVAELAGGQLKVISKLELGKRDDITDED